MSLKIVDYPNKILQTPAQKVVDFDDNLKSLVSEMVKTMHQEKGIGLAAPQIGKSLRLTVIEYKKQEDDDFEIPLLVLVNPKIISKSTAQEVDTEGCLSLLGIEVPVARHKKIKVKAQDLEGNKIRLTASGLFARIIQHELDHLDGKMIIDYAANKEALLKKYEQLKK